MLKLIISRNGETNEDIEERKCVQVINASTKVENEKFENKVDICEGMVLENSEVMKRIDLKMKHLDPGKKSGSCKFCKYV